MTDTCYGAPLDAELAAFDEVERAYTAAQRLA